MTCQDKDADAVGERLRQEGINRLKTAFRDHEEWIKSLSDSEYRAWKQARADRYAEEQERIRLIAEARHLPSGDPEC